ncbi:unnamed protein product [Chrysodeixis includens]|uniref:G-protein coupled receptors family 1 profile domain-containing protein n=1 Tax=Chrysodeixis includens TaxID=689277 RepID=A0A9N8Q1W5_CHRIL|nr:unnamed protein product [Chrysodeixis includens]
MDINSTISSLLNVTELMNTTDVLNSTVAGAGGGRVGGGAMPVRHLSKVFSVVVKVVYAVGIVGNAAAIVALRRGERRVRNRKHLLLLTSLAANDLVALSKRDGLHRVERRLSSTTASHSRWCRSPVLPAVRAAFATCPLDALHSYRYSHPNCAKVHIEILCATTASAIFEVGMMCAMLVGEHVAGVRTTRAYCATRVVLRVFGIGSVCIAVTMALERYLALTRPFLYQKLELPALASTDYHGISTINTQKLHIVSLFCDHLLRLVTSLHLTRETSQGYSQIVKCAYLGPNTRDSCNLRLPARASLPVKRALAPVEARGPAGSTNVLTDSLRLNTFLTFTSTKCIIAHWARAYLRFVWALLSAHAHRRAPPFRQIITLTVSLPMHAEHAPPPKYTQQDAEGRAHTAVQTALMRQQVTYYVIRTALLVSWFWAACLTCAPILGLGLYYDENLQQCTRYRNAVSPTDFAYAAFYVAFGIMLCIVLVYCNLAVIRALYAITAPRGSQPVVRRVSKSSASRQRQRSVHSAGAAAASPPLHNAATAEEVAFSRLMATLAVLFMICWMPQMFSSSNEEAPTNKSLVSFTILIVDEYIDTGISMPRAPRTLAKIFHCYINGMRIKLEFYSYELGGEPLTSSLYLVLGPDAWARLAPLANLSDVLMLLNYVLNPILYVLMRQRRRLSLTNLCHSIAHCFKRSHKTSTESMSMKTSCCPQETLVVSDSSGAAAELRPLRPALSAHPSAHTLRIDD